MGGLSQFAINEDSFWELCNFYFDKDIHSVDFECNILIEYKDSDD